MELPDHVPNQFIIQVPLDRLRDVLNELHDKAELEWPTNWSNGWHTTYSATYERVPDHPDQCVSFLATFHDTKEAALFRMFNEDIATMVTEEDRQKVIDDYEAMVIETAEEIAKEQFWKGTVTLKDPCKGIMGYNRTFELENPGIRCPYTYIANDDLPTSPRVTIR